MKSFQEDTTHLTYYYTTTATLPGDNINWWILASAALRPGKLSQGNKSHTPKHIVKASQHRYRRLEPQRRQTLLQQELNPIQRLVTKVAAKTHVGRPRQRVQ